MKPLLTIIVWLLVIALQIALWPQITTGVQPAFTLAAALAVGLTPSQTITGPARAHVGSSSTLWTGFWLAIIAGVVLDLYAQHHFGMLLTASALGYASIWLVIRPPVDDLGWGARLTAALLAAVIYELFVLIVFTLTTAHFPLLPELLTTGLPNILGTVVAFALFSTGLGAVRRRFA